MAKPTPGTQELSRGVREAFVDESDHGAAPGWDQAPRMTAAFFKVRGWRLRVATAYRTARARSTRIGAEAWAIPAGEAAGIGSGLGACCTRAGNFMP